MAHDLTPPGTPPAVPIGQGQHALMLPADGPERTRILAFHGGGGVGGAPEMLMPFSQALMGKTDGLCVTLASYRLLDRDKAGLADMLADAARALAWCRAEAPDEARLFLLGASFGGLLALDAALNAPDRIAGIILLNPVTDIAAGGFSNRVVPQEGRADLSPMRRYDGQDILRSMRCFIAHGDRDAVVPIETSRRFARLWPVGQCEMHEFAGAGHGFFNHPQRAPAVVAQVIDFLDAGQAGGTR